MKAAFKHVHLIDGYEDHEIIDTNVYIEKGIITAITHENLFGYKEIDCKGKYMCPGLINLHAHLFGNGQPSKILGGGSLQKKVIEFSKTPLGTKVLTKMIRDNMKNQLYSGVTTLRGVGDFFYSDAAFRDAIKDKQEIGPRLLVSGPAITVPGGHGDGTFALTATSEQELQKLVELNSQHSVDLIKICVTGGVMDAKVKGEPGEVKMNLAQTKAVCEKAHSLGYQVASHTESYDGLKIALEGGVDTIEHGAQMDKEIVQLFKKNHSSLICTLSPAIPLAKFSPNKTKLNELCVYNANVVLENMISGVNTALENNIPVGLGTDSSCPFVTQYDMVRELMYFVKYANVSNKKALCHATHINAKIINIDSFTGSIEVGKSADMLIMNDNPCEDLNALKKLDYVISQGRIFKDPIPKINSKIEKELDTLL